jgi:WD40 repeat protein
MDSFKLFSVGNFVVFDSPRDRLELVRLADQRVLKTWPRPRFNSKLTDSDRTFKDAVGCYLVDESGERIALLWQDGLVEFDEDDKAELILLKANKVEILDTKTMRSMTFSVESKKIESLLAFGPDDSLFMTGEEAPLYRFDLGRFPMTEPTIVADFQSLPHSQKLVFPKKGESAISGSLSQYRPHLAKLDLGSSRRILAIHPIEVAELKHLTRSDEILVLESDFRGPQQISIWDSNSLAKKETLFQLAGDTDESIRSFAFDEDSRRLSLCTDKGNLIGVDLNSGRASEKRIVQKDLKALLSFADSFFAIYKNRIEYVPFQSEPHQICKMELPIQGCCIAGNDLLVATENPDVPISKISIASLRRPH